MKAVEGTRGGADSKFEAEPLRGENLDSGAFMYHSSFAALPACGSEAEGRDPRASSVDFQAVADSWKADPSAGTTLPCRSSPAADPSEFFGTITPLVNSNHL